MKIQPYKISVIVITIAFLSACGAHEISGWTKYDSVPLAANTYQDKFYSVILLEVTDEQGYAEYRQLSGPVFASAGCFIENELRLTDTGNGPLEVGSPNRAIVTYCDTPNAFADFANNEEYLKIKPMMMRSISRFSFLTGKSIYAETSGSRVEDRLYVIKISRFNDKPHQTELRRINPTLSPYGFHAENIIIVDHAHGIDNPSEIGIFYFDQSALQKEMYKDNSVMKAIRSFNKTYTDSFIYLEGTAI
ncbi:MAG: DUF1330 domain-containing protein [Gammaproteobacteria bacterium]|nr:DUF1330 domain-containing protein [Gammaproteobacteria bacterium]MCF6258583.1 DUF1330 domain-containing protein [Gammaproteobacteria bacterium]